MLKPLKVKHPARAEHTAPVSWTLTSLAHPLLPLLNQLHIPTILIISPLPCPSRWTLWCHHGHSLKTPSSRICHQEPPRCLLQLLPSSLHPPPACLSLSQLAATPDLPDLLCTSQATLPAAAPCMFWKSLRRLPVASRVKSQLVSCF